MMEPIQAGLVSQWRADAAGRDPAKAGAAEIKLGEWELGRRYDPYAALKHFDLAQAKSPSGSPTRGLAKFDYALTLARQGRNTEALSRLRTLGSEPGQLYWVKARAGALALATQRRRAVKVANASAGLPEAVDLLNPLCGRKSLAACLKKLTGHSEEVERVCSVTGLGSSLADLKLACDKVSIPSFLVSTDTEGLKRLPKPLVAFVDRDHFVAVMDSDRNGGGRIVQ